METVKTRNQLIKNKLTKYVFSSFLLIIFITCNNNHSIKSEHQNLIRDTILTIDNNDFKVIRYLKNEKEHLTKPYDTLIFKSKIETNTSPFKLYDYNKAFFECYKTGNDIYISYNFLIENLFTKNKFFYRIYNNLGAISDLSKIEHLKKDISLRSWANKMMYIETNREKDLHFTITNDTLKLLSDKKRERTLFFKKDTVIQKYDYNKIETIRYFKETDSINSGFDYRYINIVPVSKKDTILFQRWDIQKNEIYLQNKLYKITQNYLKYYKTGNSIYTLCKFYLKNLINKKEFHFYTYVNQGTSTGHNHPEELTAQVGISKKNDSIGIFTSTFGRKLDPFFIYFKIKNNNLIIKNVYSDQYYRNERMSYNLDTLISIKENNIIDIQKLWDNHRHNNHRFYLNDYNTKHNLKPKAKINVTPKYIHYPYNRKEAIPKEQLVFNLTFENYGQCDFHQSSVIYDQIDFQKAVRYNLTFNKEFIKPIKIDLDQFVTGAGHQIFTLKKEGKSIILKNEFKNEDDSAVYLQIFFVFDKIDKEYKLSNAYQIYKNHKHFSEIKLTDGIYSAM